MTHPHEDLVEASVTAYAKANPFLTRSDHEAAIRAVIALIAERTKDATARDLFEKELDALSASHKDLAHRVAEMGKALKDIAQQKLIEEYAAEADPNTGDWEGAYDACVRRARAVLPQSAESGSEK